MFSELISESMIDPKTRQNPQSKEDMHLTAFPIIATPEVIANAPPFDLVNDRIVMTKKAIADDNGTTQ